VGSGSPLDKMALVWQADDDVMYWIFSIGKYVIKMVTLLAHFVYV
jgi:hypothetical protein